MDSMNLRGKNIVLIAPDMYDYPEEILRTLEKYGAHVTYFRDCPHSLSDRVLKNVSKSFQHRVNAAFQNNLLKALRNKHIDIVFIIKATALTATFLDQLRVDHPNVRIIMYQWDINEKYPYLHLVDHIDECFVFDKSDTALHPKLKYLPLFFRDSYKLLRNADKEIDIDLLHIGTLHRGKSDQIKKIYEDFRLENVKVYWYLVDDFFRWARRIFKGELYLKVKFLSLNNFQILKLYGRSKAILDLPQASQKGLTMRTFEVLGAHKKLVTTNPNVVNEKIFIKELVYVLGYDDRPIEDFLKSNVEITQEMEDKIETYSIHNWLMKMFEQGTSK